MTTYIVINKETLSVAFRGLELRCASEIADVVVPNHASRVTELNNAAFSCFTEYELMVLYENVTGEKITIRPYGELIKAVRYAVENHVPIDETPYEKLLQRARETFPDAGPEALRALPPDLKPSEAIPAILAQPGKPSPPSQAKPKTPAAPKAPGEKPKGTTGRVWEIGAEVLASGITDWKAIRAEVITRCEAEGINSGTAATQFGKWKKSVQTD